MYGSSNLVRKYEEQAINTMSSGELIVRLYDEVIKNLKFASKLFGQGNSKVACKCTGKCRNILNYLIAILNGKYKFSATLSRLYSYMAGQIVITEATSDTSHIDNIIPQLEELRSAWTEAEKGLHEKGRPAAQNAKPGVKQ